MIGSSFEYSSVRFITSLPRFFSVADTNFGIGVQLYDFPSNSNCTLVMAIGSRDLLENNRYRYVTETNDLICNIEISKFFLWVKKVCTQDKKDMINPATAIQKVTFDGISIEQTPFTRILPHGPRGDKHQKGGKA